MRKDAVLMLMFCLALKRSYFILIFPRKLIRAAYIEPVTENSYRFKSVTTGDTPHSVV